MPILTSLVDRLGIKAKCPALEADALCFWPSDLFINSKVFEEVEDELIFLKY